MEEDASSSSPSPFSRGRESRRGGRGGGDGASMPWRIGKRLVCFFALGSTFAVLSLAMLPVSAGLAWFFKPAEFRSTQRISLDYREFHPSGTACFVDAKAAPKWFASIPKRVIQKESGYQAVLKLWVPESDHNLQLGMFQVSSEALSTSGEVLHRETVPCILKFRNRWVRTARTFMLAVPLMWGWIDEHQVLDLPLFRSRETDPPFACVRVILEPSAGHPPGQGLPETYDAFVTVKSHVSQLYSWVYFFVLTCIIWGFSSFLCFVFSCVVVFVGNTLLSSLFSTEKASAISRERLLLNHNLMEIEDESEEGIGVRNGAELPKASLVEVTDDDDDETQDDAEIMALLRTNPERKPLYPHVFPLDREGQAGGEHADLHLPGAKSPDLDLDELDENENESIFESLITGGRRSEAIGVGKGEEARVKSLSELDHVSSREANSEEGIWEDAVLRSALKGKRVGGHSESALNYLMPGAAELKSEPESDVHSSIIEKLLTKEDSELVPNGSLSGILEEDHASEGITDDSSAKAKWKGKQSVDLPDDMNSSSSSLPDELEKKEPFGDASVFGYSAATSDSNPTESEMEQSRPGLLRRRPHTSQVDP